MPGREGRRIFQDIGIRKTRNGVRDHFLYTAAAERGAGTRTRTRLRGRTRRTWWVRVVQRIGYVQGKGVHTHTRAHPSSVAAEFPDLWPVNTPPEFVEPARRDLHLALLHQRSSPAEPRASVCRMKIMIPPPWNVVSKSQPPNAIGEGGFGTIGNRGTDRSRRVEAAHGVDESFRRRRVGHGQFTTPSSFSKTRLLPLTPNLLPLNDRPLGSEVVVRPECAVTPNRHESFLPEPPVDYSPPKRGMWGSNLPH